MKYSTRDEKKVSRSAPSCVASSRDPLGGLASLLRGSGLLVSLPGGAGLFGMEFWCRYRSYNTGDLWGALGGEGRMLRRCNLQMGGRTQKFTNYDDNKTKYAAIYELLRTVEGSGSHWSQAL